ncbi:hypothetical protein MAPG_08891 [Magnaporthiopsis poae ATCC 64411]|uniref:Peptidase S8/S53 domain-containing protein n=1 Tax=Magnaporthiopsis poae (strain ATCC 64411 / 73-15) TaxID=644358 RepID=A0A0C4E8I2_MAGP6|nr:hypothetical protein MAPG_08891 [Magnaporthiopsis poae ATCC 64411]
MEQLSLDGGDGRNLSLTLNPNLVPVTKADPLTELNDALVNVPRKVLLYCAGEDSGEYESTENYRKPYPANSNTKRIKRIGSAGQNGKASTSTNTKNVDYLFPGEVVSVKGSTTSSSAATALASGFAALVLWCAEAWRVQCKKEGKEPEDCDFQQPGRMDALFDKLKVDANEASLVNVTAMLDEAAADEVSEPAAALVKLCKALIPGEFKEPKKAKKAKD